MGKRGLALRLALALLGAAALGRHWYGNPPAWAYPLVVRAYDAAIRAGLPDRWRVRAVKLFRRTVILGCAAIIQQEEDAGERRYLFARHRYSHGARGEIWALPGGALGHEPLVQGLIREVYEELGIQVSVRRLLAVDTSSRDEANFYFACSMTGGEFRPSDEVVEIRYIPATIEDPTIDQGQLAVVRRTAERDVGGAGPLFLA